MTSARFMKTPENFRLFGIIIIKSRSRSAAKLSLRNEITIVIISGTCASDRDICYQDSSVPSLEH